MSENIELLEDIARATFSSDSLKELNWNEVSVVFEVNPDGKVDGTYGYAYDIDNKATAISVRPRDVRPAVSAYREWLRLEGDKGFIKMLFQFNRKSRKVNALFEFEDPTRWQVTPKNIDTIVEELRPNLGG
ncbi:hypothetical protein HB779_08215 [Phyllobacterium sp. 628]|uniref:hypothetical protein n=1 Tax=Phyllobacterium sp. 628 TaxID=2718938 RepID=UPI00166267F7|nr:hypothetical protein [Phyllobacterium sp. 628]QND51889.1 hypothetical protein HB779_08215 [Phyllobacterium sp. 628]